MQKRTLGALSVLVVGLTGAFVLASPAMAEDSVPDADLSQVAECGEAQAAGETPAEPLSEQRAADSREDDTAESQGSADAEQSSGDAEHSGEAAASADENASPDPPVGSSAGEVAAEAVTEGATAESACLSQPSDCDAYLGSAAWCEAGVEDYDCGDIPNEFHPVELVDASDDPFRLDADNDGEGCELPDGATTPPGDVDQGGLPVTGTSLPTLGGVGAGAVALGTALLLVSRRRTSY